METKMWSRNRCKKKCELRHRREYEKKINPNWRGLTRKI